jgi:mycothiol synthase
MMIYTRKHLSGGDMNSVSMPGEFVNLFSENILIRHPSAEDIQATLEFMVACDIAEFGESDYVLEELSDQWSGIDLNQDAWLVISPAGQMIGYAIVLRKDNAFTFDFFVHPALAPDGLTRHLLEMCASRANKQLPGGAGAPATASFIVSQRNLANQQVADRLGYQPYKYHLVMQVTLKELPCLPVWPEGITLRNAAAGQDDRMIYELIQAAFDRSDRVPPSFESWHENMMEASIFDSNLWFLAFHGEDLVGAVLCFEYPLQGWVRQLGVAQKWRRHGIGRALLQHIFGVFYRRGQAQVGLGVESTNSNAYQLYEKVGMKCKHKFIQYRKTLTNA